MFYPTLASRTVCLRTGLIPQSVKEKLYPRLSIKLNDERPIIYVMRGSGLLKDFNGWMREVQPEWKDVV